MCKLCTRQVLNGIYDSEIVLKRKGSLNKSRWIDSNIKFAFL